MGLSNQWTLFVPFSVGSPASTQEVRVEHKTKTCVWLERVRCKEEEEDEGASGTFNEGNGGQTEQHLRNSLVIVKSICSFM